MSAIDLNTTALRHPSSSLIQNRAPTLPSPPPSPTSSHPLTILPQPCADPSLLDSVAGFINDVVPQAATAAAAVAYNGVGGVSGSAADSGRDQIQWARFEQRGMEGTEDETEDVGWRWFGSEKAGLASGGDKWRNGIVLVVGYSNGVQVWSIPANGEAVLLLSWRHGNVRVLRILPQPRTTSSDLYAAKRPLIALCDNATPGGIQYCSLLFISLKTGEQVKVINFSKPIVDVHANSRSICVSLSERIAVFSACTLEDRLTVTTCYPSPGLHPNPVALGVRWLAYAEGRLIPARRSGGGSEGEGVQSYTATVLHAAKSLGRGLRELGETVASSLTGTKGGGTGLTIGSGAGSGAGGGVMVGGEIQQQKGVVTILDIESPSIDPHEKIIQHEMVISHFVAHTEAIVCMSFDPSGMLLLTADKRGHDFHLFRIHPHPAGPHLAAVHHLYILHRGDTTARVQDATFSPDSRWCAVTTLRGTTHVFPTTPYGGPISHRTHSTPHIVNRMSRFHRSAGLNADLTSTTATVSGTVGGASSGGGLARSNSPVPMVERADGTLGGGGGVMNPRLGPYPGPTVVMALAQIRQQVQMGGVGGQSGGASSVSGGQMAGRTHGGRQRLASGSDSDSPQVALRVSACFAPPRAWLDGLQCIREPTNVTKPHARPVDALFIMTCHGSLIQYDLDPHHAAGIPKEKICDDTSIELSVTAKAQWPIQRQTHSRDLQLPLSGAMLSHIYQERLKYRYGKPDHTDDRWLSQVEIVTHAGPHRRLWMGPQFQFQTYQNGTQGMPENILDIQHTTKTNQQQQQHVPSPLTKNQHNATKPVNIKPTLVNNRCSTVPYPILIEAGSVSSCEPSPKLFEQHHLLSTSTHQQQYDEGQPSGEILLRENLADAMMEQERQQQQQHNAGDPAAGGGIGGGGTGGATSGRCVIVSLNNKSTIIKQNQLLHNASVSSTITKIVNPLGTVLTVPSEDRNFQPIATDLDNNIILENCDESLFRPVVQSKAILYAEPICLQTKKNAANTIHVSTSKVKQKKNGKKLVPVEIKEKTQLPLQVATKVKKPRQEALLIDIPTPNQFEPSIEEPSVALYQSLDQDDLMISTAVSLTVDDAMQEAATESAEQNSLCDFSEVVFDYPKQFVVENPVVPDDLDTYAYSPSPSKTEEVSHKKPIKYDRYQGLESKDIVVSSSEENAAECERNLSKKIRKPKAKLGIRINKDTMNESKKSEIFNSRLIEPLEFEIIPAPKFSWSSIVAAPATTSAKTAELSLPLGHDCPIGAFSTFDAWNEFPEIAQPRAEYVIQQEPTKTWSSILKTAKQVDLISTVAPYVESNQLIQVDSDVEADMKLKLSSDEEKPSEPSAEDDDSPANAMDTEEDAQKIRSGGEHTVVDGIYRDAEDFSSASSFSSASRASPTPSYSGDNLLHFPGDSSGSL